MKSSTEKVILTEQEMNGMHYNESMNIRIEIISVLNEILLQEKLKNDSSYINELLQLKKRLLEEENINKQLQNNEKLENIFKK